MASVYDKYLGRTLDPAKTGANVAMQTAAGGQQGGNGQSIWAKYLPTFGQQTQQTVPDYSKMSDEEKANAYLTDKYKGHDYFAMRTALGGLTGPDDGYEANWLKEQMKRPEIMTADVYRRLIDEANGKVDAAKTELAPINSPEQIRKREIQARIDAGEMIEMPEELKNLEDPYSGRAFAAKDEYTASSRDLYMLGQGNKYSFLSQNADFAEKSRPTGKMGDQTYNIINGLISTPQHNVDRSNLTMLTDEEKATYNYIYNTQGKKAARAYIDDYLSYSLNERKQEQNKEAAANFADEAWAGATLASAGTAIGSGFGLMSANAQRLWQNMTEDYKPIDYNTNAFGAYNYTQGVREEVAANIDKTFADLGWTDENGRIAIDAEKNPELKLMARIFNGKGASDAYQLGTSMLDSGVSMAITAGLRAMGIDGETASTLGGLALGGAAGTAAMLEAIGKGANDREAMQLGIAAGLIESATEKWSIEALFNAPSKSVLKQMLKQGGFEAQEEALSEVLNTIADVIIRGDAADFKQAVEKDGLGKAVFDLAIQTGWSATGGFLSGFAMGGIGQGVRDVKSTANYRFNADSYQQALENAEKGGKPLGAVGQLAERVRDTTTNGRSLDISNEQITQQVSELLALDPNDKVALQIKERLDAGKKVGGNLLSRLDNRFEIEATKADMADIEKAVEARASEINAELDEETIKAVAQAMADAVVPEDARQSTGRQEWLINHNEAARQLVTEATAMNYDGFGGSWAADIGTRTIGQALYGKTKTADAFAEQRAKKNGTAYDAGTNQATRTRGELHGARMRQAVKDITAAEISQAISGMEAGNISTTTEDGLIINTTGNQITVKLAGSEAVQTATLPENADLDTVAAKAAEMAQPLVAKARNIKNLEDYTAAGLHEDLARKTAFAENLSEDEVEQAIARGRERNAAEIAKREAQRKTKDGNNWKEGVVAGIGVTAEELKQLTHTNKAYAILQDIAKATGLRIEVFRSGGVGEKGSYQASTNVIRLDLDAYGNKVDGKLSGDQALANYAILTSFSHEFTHFLEQNAPAEWEELSSAVLNELANKGLDVDGEIRRVMYVERNEAFKAVKRKNMENGMSEVDAGLAAREYVNKKIDYDYARREVVAEAMTDMLRDSRWMEQIAEKNPSLLQRIIDGLKRFLADIKEVWSNAPKNEAFGVSALTEVRNGTVQYLENIIELYDKAAVKAVENYNENEVTVENATEETGMTEVKTDEYGSMDEEDAYIESVVADIGDRQFSIRSMRNDISDEVMFRDLVKYGIMDESQANELKQNLTELTDLMAMNPDILDMNEDYTRDTRPYKVFKPNSDPLYTLSLDFSTLCRKRLMTQYIIEKLQSSLKDESTGKTGRALTAEEQLAVRDMLKEYAKQNKALQVACAMCYVEAARLKSPAQIMKFIHDPEAALTNYFAKNNKEFKAKVEQAQADWKVAHGYEAKTAKKDMSGKDKTAFNKMSAALRQTYKPNAEEMAIIEQAKQLPNDTYLSAGKLTQLAIEHPEIHAAYTATIRAATRSKSLESDVPYYYGDSKGVVTDGFIKSVNAENGMRFSSWSDFQMKHMLDMMTAVIELSTRKCAMHGYTKFLEQVRIFGKTGMMFNMSGVAVGDGFNADGSLAFSETESVKVHGENGEYDAIKARDEFPETAGLQCIGISNKHIMALLDSDFIDYIIPYHVSGLNKGLRTMANINHWDDFTEFQNAKEDGTKFDAKKHNKETWHKEPVFSEFFVGYDTGMSGIEAMRASAERYKQLCRERGLMPKFSWKNSKVNSDFNNHPDYWKLLIDRKMINQKTGELIEQKPVTPTFDFAAIKNEVSREVASYDAQAEEKALAYVREHLDEMPKRIKELKKAGAVKETLKKSKAVEEAKKNLGTIANAMLAGDVQHRLRIRYNDGNVVELDNAHSITREEIIKYIEQAKKRKLLDNTYFPIAAETPVKLLNSIRQYEPFAPGGMLVMQAEKTADVMKDHHLTAEQLLNILDGLEEPVGIVYQTERIDDNGKPLPNNFAVFVNFDVVNEDGTVSEKEGVAVVEFDAYVGDENVSYESGETAFNTVVTVFEPSKVDRKKRPVDYYINLLNRPGNIDVPIIENEDIEPTTAIGPTRPAAMRTMSSNGMLSETDGTVNTQFRTRTVEPVMPSSGLWERGHDEAWFRENGYPIYMDVPQDVKDANDAAADEFKRKKGGKHGTQIQGTKTTYEQLFTILKGRKGWQNMRVLDASSGLGLGTRVGREMGFNVTDIEPFPDNANYGYDKATDGKVNPNPGAMPDYTDYDQLETLVETGQIKPFDFIISNAVLNVVPQDTRDQLAVAMGHLLAPGGQMFINVISKQYQGALDSTSETQYKNGKKVGSVRTAEGDYTSKGNKTGRGHETFVWGSNSVQKVFSNDELNAYLKDALGPGYTVETYSKLGMTAALVTKDANYGGNDDTQHRSRVTPQMDAEYNKALEAGDTETMKQIVKQAANAAGYTITAFHGTDYYKPITVFKRGKTGYLGGGIYLTDNRSKADYYANKSGYGGTVYDVYARMDNPIRCTSDVPAREILRTIYGNDSVYERRAAKSAWGQDLITNADIKKAQAMGYDGVIWEYGTSPVEYCVWEPNQVKSADAVTRDNKGKPISLSERFNEEEKDIRYRRRSIPSTTELLDRAAEDERIIKQNARQIAALKRQLEYWRKQTQVTIDPKTGKPLQNATAKHSEVLKASAKLNVLNRMATQADRTRFNEAMQRVADMIVRGEEENHIITEAMEAAYYAMLAMGEWEENSLAYNKDYIPDGAVIFDGGELSKDEIREFNRRYGKRVRFTKDAAQATIGADEIVQQFNGYEEEAYGDCVRKIISTMSEKDRTFLANFTEEEAGDLSYEMALNMVDALTTGVEPLFTKMDKAEQSKRMALEKRRETIDGLREELRETQKALNAEKDRVWRMGLEQSKADREHRAELNAAVNEAYANERRAADYQLKQAENALNAEKDRVWRMGLEQSAADRKHAAEVQKLEEKAQKLADRIAALREQNREDMAELRAKRDQRIAELKQHQAEMRKKQRERRAAADMRAKIGKLESKFTTMLLRPGKDAGKHAPVEMLEAVRDLCVTLAQADMVRLTERMETMTDESTRAKAEKRMAGLGTVIEKYKALSIDNGDGLYSSSYNETVLEMLKTVRDEIGEKSLHDLNSEELGRVYDALRAVYKTIVDANKLHMAEKTKDLVEMTDGLRKNILDTTQKKGKAAEIARRYMMWQMRPDTFFDYICGFAKDNYGKEIQSMCVKGTERMLGVQREFYNMFRHISESNRTEWQNAYAAMNSSPTKEMLSWGLEDENGKAVQTSRGMMLQAYMLLSQEDSFESIIYGGLSLPNAETYYAGKIAESYGGTRDGENHSRSINKEYGDIMHELNGVRSQVRAIEQKQQNGNATQADLDKLSMLQREVQALTAQSEDALVESRDYWNTLRENIEKQLTDFDRELIDTAARWYGYSGELMDEVFLDMYGYKAKRVNGYVPIHRDTGFVQTALDTTVDKISLENAGFTKERVKSKAPILLTDIMTELSTQQQRMSRYYGFAEVQADLNRVMNMRLPGGKSLKTVIGDYYGYGGGIMPSGMQYINNYIENIAGQSRGDAGALHGLYGNMAGATLSLNVRVALSQLASIPTAAASVGWGNMARGFSRGVSTAFSTKAKNDLAQKSVWFWQRYRGEGGMAEISAARETKLWGKVQNSKVGKALLNWCQDMDTMATATMWAMAEEDVMSRGISRSSDRFEAAVQQKYRDIIRETQPNYTTTERSDLLRNKSDALKIFTMYKTQSNQNLNILIQANMEYNRMVRDHRDQKNGVTAQDVSAAKQRAVNANTAVLIGGTVAFAALRMMADFIMGTLNNYRDDDKELTGKSITQGFMQQVMQALTGMFTLGGDVYNVIYSGISGERYYGLSDSAVGALSDGFEQTRNTINKLTKWASGDEELSWAAAGKLAANNAKTFANLMGVPVGNAMKIGSMVEMYFKDLVNGTFGKFEGNVDYTKADNAHRLVTAFADGNERKQERLLAALAAQYGDEKSMKSGIKAAVKKALLDGEISRELADEMLKELDILEEDDEKTVTEWVEKDETKKAVSKLSDYNITNWRSGLSDTSLTDSEKDSLVKYFGKGKEPAFYTKLRGYGYSAAQADAAYQRLDADGNGYEKKAEVFAWLYQSGMSRDKCEDLWSIFGFKGSYGGMFKETYGYYPSK